ncbi:Signal transduction histidine kinase [Pseudooceanicola antarcticus]|uniref:histidine kinase n=1 Tax=Pseudooceanicola antarcticus TaxID=1247613 RepID=A0A285J852_9RHOB|nr:ATP-binding protein [Pseudooceanicola antarcticus]PJE26852.1 hypothetical protein CVM39_16075 [Pseudooceanicola antarcticus]SNY55516.1 Signal transduction histidine kinase [Pseudooceanicola antarcticus]
MELMHIFETDQHHLVQLGAILLAILALLIQGRAYRARGRRMTQLAQDLQESQRIARIGTVRWDFQQDRVEWTDEYARLLALPFGGHMTGGEFQAMLLPEYEDQVVESERTAIATSAKTGKPARREIVYKVRARDGRIIDISAVSELMADRDGRPLYLISTIRDVTDELAQQAKLAESEHNLAAALRVADLHWLRQEHPTGKVTWSNGMNRLLGRPDDAPPLLLRHYIDRDDFRLLSERFEKQRDEGVGRGKVNHTTTLKLKRTDDSNLYARAYFEATLDEDRELESIRAVFRDVSEEVAQEAKLHEAVEAAQMANRSKSEFLAVISHELRTPLNGVLGMLGALEDGNLAGEPLEQVKVARRSANDLLVILNDILDASKIEAGRMQIEEENFELEGLVDSVIHLYGRQAQEKGIELEGRIDAGLPAWVRADAGRVRQILSNLISNAIKFTSEGSVVLSIGASPNSTPERLELRLSVRDTGAGIPEEYHSRVFGRFEQLGASYSNRMAGTGLGLSISLRLAELMGGKMDFTSRENAGSCFWLDLPVEATEAVDRKEDPEDQQIELPRMRILVAEDNSTNQLVIRSMLDRMGQNVDLVVNGAEAVQAVRDFDYDIVLMDVSMPVLDGTGATRQIRALPSRGRPLPILGLTAHAGADQHEFYLETGFDEVLTKPITAHQLAAALYRWIPAELSSEPGTVIEPTSSPTQRAPEPLPPAPGQLEVAKASAEISGAVDFVDSAAFRARLVSLNEEFSGGLTEKMLQATRRDVDRHIGLLKTQLAATPETADNTALARSFHSLVGIFSTLGCETMTTQCRLLESLPDPHGEAPTLIKDLLEQLQAMRREITTLTRDEAEAAGDSGADKGSRQPA